MLEIFWKSSTDFGINEQGGQIYLLNLISEQGKNLQVWWKKNLKNLSEHACLLGTSDWVCIRVDQRPFGSGISLLVGQQ